MVHIKYACLENWNEMRPVQGGRMCDRCAHKVVDYSQSSGPIEADGGCGRFRLEQVESVRRTLRASQWAGWSMGLFAFLGLLDGSEAAAQTEVPPVEGAVPERSAVGRLRIHGHVVTAVGGQALEARFEVYRNGVLVRALKTDLDGRFDLLLDTTAYDLRELEVRFIAPEGLESRVGPEGLEVALEAGEMVVELELVQDSHLKREMPETEWLRDRNMKIVIVGRAGAIHPPMQSQIDPFTSGSRFSGEEIERFGRR